MSASKARAGEAYVEISTRNGLLDKGLAAAQASMRRLAATTNTISSTMGKGFASVGGALSTVGGSLMSVRGMIAGLAASAGVGAMVKGFADAAGNIDDMSKRTGLAAEEIQGLSFAARMSGTSIETVEGAVKKMQKAGFSTGRGPLADFEALADRIAAIPDPAARAAEAMKYFGRSGTQLLPMFENGSAGIQDLMREADRLGLVLSGPTVSAGEQLGDTIDKVVLVMGGFANRIGATLAPLVMDLADRLLSLAESVTTFIENNADTIVFFAQVAAGVAAFAAGVVALGGVIGGAGAVFTALSTAVGIVGAGLVAILSPIGLITVGIGGLVAAFLYFSGVSSQVLQYLQDQFQAMVDFVLPIFQSISTALMSGQWAAAGEIAMLAFELAIRTGMQPLYGLWSDLYTWIATGAIDAVTTIANVFAGIPTAIMNGFSTAITWLTGTWDRTVNSIAKSLLYLYSLFDRSINYAEAAKQMDQDAMARAAQRQKDLDAAKNKRNEDLNQANQARAEFSEGIKQGVRDQAEEKKSQFEARVDEIKVQIQAKMDEVNIEAQRQAEERAKVEPPPKPKPPPEIGNIEQSVALKTQGSFSGFAAGMLGTGTSALDRLQNETKKQTNILQSIADNTAEDDALALS